MNHANHRRGWFQLSLRSIFLLVLVVAAYFAGYRTAVRHGEQAQEAEREARKLAEEALEEARRQESMAILELQRAENRALAVQLLALLPTKNEPALPPIRRTR